MQGPLSATAQALRPGATVEFRPNLSWSVNGEFAYDRGEVLQEYNNFYSAAYVSYQRPLRHTITDNAGSFAVDYPLRFSVGIMTEQFPNFTGITKSVQLVRPIFRLSVF